MKTAVKRLEPTKIQLTITLDGSEINPFLNKERNKIAQQIAIPGFRKGHVPAKVIDARFGFASIVSESLNEIIPNFYTKAMDKRKLHAMGQPNIDVVDMPESADSDKNLRFKAEVEVRPEFTLPDPATLTISVPNSDVTEDDIAKHLEDLQHRFGSLTGVDRPVQKDDFVNIDIEASLDGKVEDTQTGMSYEVGSESMFAGLDDALIGLSAGDTANFDAPLLSGEHAGETAQIKVTFNSVKQEELPELNDEFAQEASEFDTLDELKDSIRKQSLLDAAARQANDARDAFIDRLEEGLDIPVPAGALETTVQNHLRGMADLSKLTEEEMDSAKKSAEKELRDQMVLDTLTETLDINVNQNDISNFLTAVAQQYGIDPSQFIEAVIKNGQFESAVVEVGRQKGMVAGMRLAKFIDADGEPVDLTQFLGAEEEDEAEESKSSKKSSKKSAQKSDSVEE